MNLAAITTLKAKARAAGVPIVQLTVSPGVFVATFADGKIARSGFEAVAYISRHDLAST